MILKEKKEANTSACKEILSECIQRGEGQGREEEIKRENKLKVRK
jgi:hypothetical protein